MAVAVDFGQSLIKNYLLPVFDKNLKLQVLFQKIFSKSYGTYVIRLLLYRTPTDEKLKYAKVEGESLDQGTYQFWDLPAVSPVVIVKKHYIKSNGGILSFTDTGIPGISFYDPTIPLICTPEGELSSKYSKPTFFMIKLKNSSETYTAYRINFDFYGARLNSNSSNVIMFLDQNFKPIVKYTLDTSDYQIYSLLMLESDNLKNLIDPNSKKIYLYSNKFVRILQNKYAIVTEDLYSQPILSPPVKLGIYDSTTRTINIKYKLSPTDYVVNLDDEIYFYHLNEEKNIYELYPSNLFNSLPYESYTETVKPDKIIEPDSTLPDVDTVTPQSVGTYPHMKFQTTIGDNTPIDLESLFKYNTKVYPTVFDSQNKAVARLVDFNRHGKLAINKEQPIQTKIDGDPADTDEFVTRCVASDQTVGYYFGFFQRDSAPSMNPYPFIFTSSNFDHLAINKYVYPFGIVCDSLDNLKQYINLQINPDVFPNDLDVTTFDKDTFVNTLSQSLKATVKLHSNFANCTAEFDNVQFSPSDTQPYVMYRVDPNAYSIYYHFSTTYSKNISPTSNTVSGCKRIYEFNNVPSYVPMESLTLYTGLCGIPLLSNNILKSSTEVDWPFHQFKVNVTSIPKVRLFATANSTDCGFDLQDNTVLLDKTKDSVKLIRQITSTNPSAEQVQPTINNKSSLDLTNYALLIPGLSSTTSIEHISSPTYGFYVAQTYPPISQVDLSKTYPIKRIDCDSKDHDHHYYTATYNKTYPLIENIADTTAETNTTTVFDLQGNLKQYNQRLGNVPIHNPDNTIFASGRVYIKTSGSEITYNTEKVIFYNDDLLFTYAQSGDPEDAFYSVVKDSSTNIYKLATYFVVPDKDYLFTIDISNLALTPFEITLGSGSLLDFKFMDLEHACGLIYTSSSYNTVFVYDLQNKQITEAYKFNIYQYNPSIVGINDKFIALKEPFISGSSYDFDGLVLIDRTFNVGDTFTVHSPHDLTVTRLDPSSISISLNQVQPTSDMSLKKLTPDTTVQSPVIVSDTDATVSFTPTPLTLYT